jgi:HEAT repeat protein
MVDSRMIQALGHADPAIRKKAIVALGKSQDKDALPILANVYKNDPDPDVRQYARKAGQMLKQSLATRQADEAPHVKLAQEAVQ